MAEDSTADVASDASLALEDEPVDFKPILFPFDLATR
jgi:hypothetical protein